ncbi:MAG: hypothetical protein AAF922_02805 [Pseudomonadota bacterium]
MLDTKTFTASARRVQTVMTLCLALFATLFLALILGGLIKPHDVGALIAEFAGFEGENRARWQDAGLIAVVALNLAIWTVLVFYARQVFAHLATGVPDAAAYAARRLSYWIWIMLAWGLLSQALTSLLATWGYPEGQRAIAIGLGIPQISTVLAALVTGFMAQTFAFGAELWRDHQEVV